MKNLRLLVYWMKTTCLQQWLLSMELAGVATISDSYKVRSTEVA